MLLDHAERDLGATFPEYILDHIRVEVSKVHAIT